MPAKFPLAQVTVECIVITHEMTIGAEMEAGERLLTDITERRFQLMQEGIPDKGLLAFAVAILHQDRQAQFGLRKQGHIEQIDTKPQAMFLLHIGQFMATIGLGKGQFGP